ncbi:MAG: hypothetical protein COB67_12820 [SAR324 cluster bacterium]|uniref:Uncharacterized protein n=1 Tax=SAR324 cluster bacterium TaxID=2024889 RepID=A0A2A4SQN7_9DELT|nr:MAG: hypothetical protein COB67_12820 [SAR324 cluster bacterium]
MGALVPILMFSVIGCSSSDSSSTDDSGGDSGGGTSMPTASAGSGALTVSSKVSVVDAQSGNGSNAAVSSSTILISKGSRALFLDMGAISGPLNSAYDTSTFAANADYNQDESHTFVHEESVQVLDTVNNILCSIAQTKYSEMLGKGDYRVQVDQTQCDSDRDSASSKTENSQNQSSTSTKTEYETWTVNSSRAADQPHIVKLWINQEASERDDASLIFAKMEIYRSSSEGNPYGYFKMNFVGHPLDANGSPDTTQVLFKGYMKTVLENSTNKVLLQFSNSMSFGTQTFTEQATFKRSADGTSGSGTLSAPDFSTMQSQSDTPTQATFDLAYNASNFLRSNGTEQKCFDRSSFQNTIWSYGMYDTNGARVNINSGFPITYTSAGTDYHGWVGYHGLWMPGDVTLTSGATVSKETYNASGGTSEDYEVFIAGGRLIKHSKQSTTLGEIKNVPLQWNYYDSNTNQSVEYQVIWTGTKLQKTATLNRNDWSWEPLSSPQDLSFSGDDYEFHFWSEVLGGSGRIALKDTSNNAIAIANATPVIFHTQNVVYPTDTVPATLSCFNNCPDPSKLNTNTSDVNLTDVDWYQDATSDTVSFNDYTFNTTDMELKYSGTPVVMTSSNTNFSWGVHTGMLFENNGSNQTAIQCDWDTSKTCLWKAYDNMNEYYTWETGTDSWNKFTAIKTTGGTFAKFDPPIKVTYQHSQSNATAPDYKYNGVKFNLDYSGFGNLHGIPGRCIDKDGEATSCNGNVRWVPEFSIPVAEQVTNLLDNTTYVLKPLEMEQRMTLTDAANCSTLSLPSFTLPSLSSWEDPVIGDQPTVAGAPAVVGGVVQ